MVKVLAACGNGKGSSMVIKMKVENALQAKPNRLYSNSCSVGEAKVWQLAMISLSPLFT